MNPERVDAYMERHRADMEDIRANYRGSQYQAATLRNRRTHWASMKRSLFAQAMVRLIDEELERRKA